MLMSWTVTSPTATLTRPSYAWVAELPGAAAPVMTTAPANSETTILRVQLIVSGAFLLDGS